MADQPDPSYDDLLGEANRLQTQDLTSAQHQLSAINVGQEQAGYQSTIDGARANGGSATAPPGAQPGMVSSVVGAVLKGGEDALEHPIDTFNHGWNGAATALQELSISVDELASKVPGYDTLRGNQTHDQYAAWERANNSFLGGLKVQTDAGNTAGNLVEGVTQFVAGKAVLAAATGGESVVAQGMQSIGTMAAAFNPHDPHFNDLLSKFPGLSAATKAALASKPDDPEWEGRLRGAMDGLGFEAADVAMNGFVSFVKGIRGVSQAADMQRGIETAKPLSVNTSTNPTPEIKPDLTTDAGKGVPGAAAPEGTAQDRFMAEFNKLPDHPTQVGHKLLEADEAKPAADGEPSTPSADYASPFISKGADADFGHEVIATGADNGSGGHAALKLYVKNDTLSVASAFNGMKDGGANQSTGKGVVTGLYKRGIEEAQQRGLAFSSDSAVSQSATKVWDRLKQQGYEVEKNPKAHLDQSNPPGWVTGDDSPVFSISNKPKAQRPGVAVEAHPDPVNPDTVHLENIRADEPGNGKGTAALKSLTDLADKHGTTLTLDAVPLDGAKGIAPDKLMDFYKAHGFEPQEGGLVEGRAMQRGPGGIEEPPQAWTPAGVKGADGTSPSPAGAPEGAPVFNPATTAAKMMTPVSKEQSAAVLKAINEGDYLGSVDMLDDTHRTIPWDQMSDGANLKGLFNAVEDHLGVQIKAAHGTAPMPMSQVQQVAKAIGGNVQSLTRLFNGVTGEGGLAARITAGYNILKASGRQLQDLAAKAKALDADTPEGAQALLDFQKQLQLHAGIVGQVRQSSQEIGRALAAHRYLKASSDVALSQISEYAGTVNGKKALKKLASQVAGSGDDLSGMTKAADQLSRKGWRGVLQEVAQNGMLSAPTTQITNIDGNIGNTLLKCGERYVAAGIGTARGIIAPNADVASFREAWAHSMGAYDGLKNGAKLAWQAMKDENFTSKFNTPTSRAIQMNTKGLSGPSATYAQVVNAVGKAIRWPGRFMGLFDHFTQSIGYEGDLSARAYVQSAKEADALGLQGDARDTMMSKRMAEIRANPTTEIEQGAMAAGKYSAFLEDPQTAFGGGLMKAFNSSPMLKLVVAPFIHRPGNMLRQGIGDYSPLSPLFKNNLEKITSGGSGTDLALARMAIGTGTMLSSYEFAQQGKIVGQRLGNKNTESLDGVPPYSAQIGSRWYKFDRLDPVGMWLGLGADLHEAIQHHYDPNDPDATGALTKASTAAIQAISQVAMDKSFMKSVEDVTSALSAKDPVRSDQLAAKLVQDNIAKLLPFSGLARAVTHGVDDSARATAGGSLFDGVVASIPYLSQTLPPRRDLLGRPVQPASWWNPLNGQPANADHMDQELSKLALNIDTPSRSINGYTLNPHEWDQIVTNATQSKLFSGRTLQEALRDSTNGAGWAMNAQAPDGGALRNGGVAQSMINSAYQYGKDKYLQDHPTFNQQKMQEASQRFLNSIANEPKQAVNQ